VEVIKVVEGPGPNQGGEGNQGGGD